MNYILRDEDKRCYISDSSLPSGIFTYNMKYIETDWLRERDIAEVFPDDFEIRTEKKSEYIYLKDPKNGKV